MRSASKIFDVNYSTVKEWVKIFKETERLSPKPICGKQPTKIDLAKLYQQVIEHPDWFQDEHAQTFFVTQSTISKALSKLARTFHKSQNTESNQLNRVEITGARVKNFAGKKFYTEKISR